VNRLNKVGDGVQATWEGIHTGVSTATSAVKSVAWPGWAAVRGVMAAVSAFRSGDSRRQTRIAERNAQLYEDQSIDHERGNDNEAVRH
jgi:hypothetical protein